MKRRILFLTILCFIATFILGVYGFANQTSSPKDFKFDKSTGTITDYVGKGTNVVIPSTIGGVTVKEIGKNAFGFKMKIKTVTIPNSVTAIRWAAFNGCTSMTSIKIPSSVSIIEGAVFCVCPKLKTVKLPEGITVIDMQTFSDCYALKSVNIPDSVTKIGMEAFASCKSLKSITIPNTVTDIGENAFSIYSKTKFKFYPSNVVTIHCMAGSYAENYAKQNGLKFAGN